MKLNEKEIYKPTFGYLPYQGWTFLFIFLTLKHFPVNFLHLSEEKCNFA